jgi:hypothetical protein
MKDRGRTYIDPKTDTDKLRLRLLSQLEASAAVNGTIVGGLEGDLCLAAAISANSREILTGCSSCVLLGIAASLASLRFVLESLLGIESLFACGEHEFIATVLADQSLVDKLLFFYCADVFVLEHGAFSSLK